MAEESADQLQSDAIESLRFQTPSHFYRYLENSMRSILIAFTFVLSCAVQAAEATDVKACEANFAVDGSFFSGKTYKTWQEFKGVTYDTAFRKASQAVAIGGWGTVTPNKDTGIITAAQTVTLGKGAIAPLNVVVQDMNSGVVRVEAVFSTGPGQMASADTAKAQLCKLVEAPGQ